MVETANTHQVPTLRERWISVRNHFSELLGLVYGLKRVDSTLGLQPAFPNQRKLSRKIVCTFEIGGYSALAKIML